MITNATSDEEIGRPKRRDPIPRTYRPAPTTSSVSRLEEVERLLASVRARPATGARRAGAGDVRR
jgi:hypothetical protein